MRGVATFIVAMALIATACSSGGGATTTTDAESTTSTGVTVPEDTEFGVVSGIISGDTVQVMIGEVPTRVRLLGIRAPQDDECYADEAALITAEVAAGRSVAVVGDQADADGTPLRYLVLDEDVPVLVNVELVARGAAAALHGHELAGDFLRVNARAYASGRGMWGTFVCGQPEEGGAPDRPQLRIADVRPAGPAGAGSVDIVNASYTAIPIGGWTLRDVAATSTYTFDAGRQISAGETLTITMSCDEATSGEAWCTAGDLFADGGNTLLIQDERGNVVERYVKELETP
jgi:endonuclease YncB( thermonuclease family)